MTTTPAHIAIVMDGNGRWARQRNLPVAAGHKAGVETVRTVLNACEARGVDALTLFAFSSENWRRPALEVSALMTLFSSYLDREVATLAERGVRLRFIGRRDRFSAALGKKIAQAEQRTAANHKFHLTLAVDYGGQWDITCAARELAEQVQAGRLQAADIDENRLAAELCLADLPAPDLLIRTSGEYRLSNFLLWQLAYAELYFTDVYWPDFDQAAFDAALASYAGRDRRFGARRQDSHA
ncbi:MAG TPA: polyprenyl diphosphate synthase [Pseudomonadales bacterium]